jgi:hypothetical protein
MIHNARVALQQFWCYVLLMLAFIEKPFLAKNHIIW